MIYNSSLVSVVMPAYNSERYIRKAIESILMQTYEKLELIIVDDASSDNTLKVVKSFCDPRIKLLQNELNRGIAYSTNRGIEEAQGEYIALLDDDDEAFTNRISAQIKYMKKHKEIDILGGRSIIIDENGNTIRRERIPHYNPLYIKAMLLLQCLDFRNGTTMIKKSFWDNNDLAYKDDYLGMQDFRLFMEASKVGVISSISNYILRWRVHGKNETFFQRKHNTEERARRYAQIQRESLSISGFRLKQEEFKIINKVLTEENVGCDSSDEWEHLYEIMKKIINQGIDMGIDYQNELEHYCKKKLAEAMMKTNFIRRPQ